MDTKTIGEGKPKEGGELLELLRALDVALAHHPCPDGESCKLLLRDLRGSTFPVRAYTHGVTDLTKDLPSFNGLRVLFIDCCPTKEVLPKLAEVAKHVLVLDHHKTALPLTAMVLPKNVRVVVESPEPCSSAYFFRLINGPNTKMPEWLRVVDLVDTGKAGSMSDADLDLHAGLTDDIDALDSTRRLSEIELVKRGHFLRTKHRPAVAQAVVNKAEIKTLTILKSTYQVAYVNLPHEKYVLPIQQLFWSTVSTSKQKVDVLALRLNLASGCTDFKLRRPPTSSFDLSALASVYGGGGHAGAAGIQLPDNPSFIPDRPAVLAK